MNEKFSVTIIDINKVRLMKYSFKEQEHILHKSPRLKEFYSL